MNTAQRLGCLSPLAVISALITLTVLAVLTAVNGSAMFSSGALNAQTGAPLGGVTSHAELSRDCASCHTAPWSGQIMAERCAACHAGVQAELGDASSLHGSFAKNGPLACQTCHLEHRGPAAGLTEMDAAAFPHQATGFELTAHRFSSGLTPFACADCHPEQISRFSPAVCADCHTKRDGAYTAAHLQTFGPDCLACHDGRDRYTDFDHSLVKYPLTGAHLKVECSGCHAGARSRADLQNTPAACGDCHLSDDPHNGAYGAQCEGCHKTGGWKDAAFDHNRSNFPLDGAHARVKCEDCHKNSVFKGTPRDCAACHADPVFHAGLFPGQACTDCHTPSAWRPARFEGKHTFPINHGEKKKNNTCADCHRPNLTQWTCYPCHNEAEIVSKHREEGIADFKDCLSCHPTGREEEGEGKGGGD